MTLNKFAALSLVLLLFCLASNAQQHKGRLSGQLRLDERWNRVIYLSHIPTFDDMYTISNENIISKAVIDSLGYFEFDISFIPEHYNLFRIHLTKPGDAPASLIIGGRDENFLFLIANKHSSISFKTLTSSPPFRKVIFTQPDKNAVFQQITNLANIADSTASVSGNTKRRFIENTMYDELLSIANSEENPLVSLYAIHKAGFESRYTSNLDFYNSYLQKWTNEDSEYFKAFRKKIEVKRNTGSVFWLVVSGGLVFALGFLAGRFKRSNTNKVEKLSIQERKIFELLRHGATNQEIADQCHIEISTVKSHVSNILSKLKLKSRKDILNLQSAASSSLPKSAQDLSG